MSRQHTANFDEHPPVPVGDYDATARVVNVGYELIFELATSLLRAHCPGDAHLLLVGAGGSTEVQVFGAADPRWRLTVVDPSANMLALARARVEACGLVDRVQLVQGTLDDLPADARFDAATAIFVLMHLPDDGSKLHLLHSIAQRLKPDAPLILVDGVLDHLGRFAPAWQHYAVARGTPSERMAAFLEQLAAGSTATTEVRELALMDEAGLRDATRFFTAFVISGWVARR